MSPSILELYLYWIKTMHNLIVEKKNVYGVERVYPVCNKAKLFATISGNKTLLPEVIELIKKLGYNLPPDRDWETG